MRVKYFDYLGAERTGVVIATMPSSIEDEPYLLIKDDDDEYNIQTYFNGTSNVNYAEIRKSTDCELVEE